jgi:hypothetical protein
MHLNVDAIFHYRSIHTPLRNDILFSSFSINHFHYTSRLAEQRATSLAIHAAQVTPQIMEVIAFFHGV